MKVVLLCRVVEESRSRGCPFGFTIYWLGYEIIAVGKVSDLHADLDWARSRPMSCALWIGTVLDLYKCFEVCKRIHGRTVVVFLR